MTDLEKFYLLCRDIINFYYKTISMYGDKIYKIEVEILGGKTLVFNDLSGYPSKRLTVYDENGAVLAKADNIDPSEINTILDYVNGKDNQRNCPVQKNND